MSDKIKTDVAFLPIKSIMIALNISKEKLLSLDVKPEIINGKQYYSLDDLGKLRKIMQDS